MAEKLDYKQMQTTSALSGANATYIEELYEQYLADNNAVEKEWQDYFLTIADVNDLSYTDIKQRFIAIGQQRPAAQLSGSTEAILEHKQAEVTRLINAYRRLGHLRATIDPLSMMELPDVEDMSLEHHDLSTADLQTEFDARDCCDLGRSNLKTIVNVLQKTYCGNIGAEIMHISNTEQRKWLLKRFEKNRGSYDFSKEEKHRVLKKLIASDGLEKYLGTKYVGQKRFSIEGADSLIPMMDVLTYYGASHGVKEIVVGMAHRGRLNMLVNFLGKAPASLFEEFEGHVKEGYSGDVKYHNGFSSNIATPDGMVHLAMAYNPSHLETVDPVVEGSVHAKQWRRSDVERQVVLPVLIHGDASFSGQGVVQETLNMSQVKGYSTGGTIHVVVNNQVGFTTGPTESRSTQYCTDIAKMVDAPIFHVNGDDPEACVYAMKLLYDYRKKFKQDVVIDLVCYRRHGHQEVDEPSMTQPLMYKVIKKHLVTYKQYAEKLQQQGDITAEEVQALIKAYRADLDSGKPVVEIDSQYQRGDKHPFAMNWKQFDETDWRVETPTAITKKTLTELTGAILRDVEHYTLQPQVAKLIENRKKMAAGEQPLDWGFAETIAYASLLMEKYPIRISGEDAQRGTFGHRHAVLHDFKTGKTITPLSELSPEQAPFWVYNSILSEYGVLGFEVGYASASPDTLVIWEAQFGDFANGAQIIIDQFISSGEQKWKQKSGLVLLLPHGYEGQGPEHSSARLERYLQLCAQHNMQVCMPTTPAQVFHMMRRQLLRNMRKPLIVMTPKSLLRAPLAVSSLEDLTQGQFQAVIPEIDDINSANVKRVILCSGKIYYDLLTARRENKMADIAIVRIEQLYPFPHEEIEEIVNHYSKAKEIVWAQEEPLNQGAWYSMRHNFVSALSDKHNLTCVSRPASAAPAVGYLAIHIKRQKAVVDKALGLLKKDK